MEDVESEGEGVGVWVVRCGECEDVKMWRVWRV